MSKLITVTFDGQVLKPKIPLNLDVNKEYQMQLISDSNKSMLIEDLELSAELYTQIYQQDLELQDLTEDACADFNE